MTARYSLRPGPAGGLVLVSKARRRATFALGLVLLVGGFVVGFDPSTELSADRAPLTVLYAILMLSCLGGSLCARRLAVEPGAGKIAVRLTIAALPVALRQIEIREGTELRLTRVPGTRAPYSLELWHPDGATVLDSSSWRSELEPMGRRIAATLGIPFSEALPASGGRDTVAAE